MVSSTSPMADASLAKGEYTKFPAAPKPSSTILREYLADPEKMVVCPGVFDGLSTRIALNTGFDALYMTGAGTSISRLGMADLGIVSLHEMRANAEMIASINPSIPLIADADTGYGGVLMVGRTTAEYIRAGVAGFHLEDQVQNKRCGHLAGKELVSEEEYISRIRAAVNMRSKLGSDIVIIARTDAIAVLGFDAAISRMHKAVAAGADVVFVEAIESIDQARAVGEIFGKTGTPCMYGMVQGTSVPRISVDEARDLGFKIIVYAAIAMMPYFASVSKAMNVLKETGEAPILEDNLSPKKIFTAMGLQELLDFDQAAA